MHIIDLSGEWTLVREKTQESYPAAVPGDNISALLEAGAIPNPYVAQNELLVQWVGQEDWKLEREFELPAEWLADSKSAEALFMHFDSIDTVAEVRVNGTVVGRSDSMFVRHRFPVGKAVQAGINRVSVLLRSPETAAREAAEELAYPLPHVEFPVQSPHRNLIRKVQCHSGWDWGPCLMVSGLYGAVYLAAPHRARVEYVHTRSHRREGSGWELEVTVEASSVEAMKSPLSVGLSGPGSVAVTERREVELGEGASSHVITLRVDRPELWWPAGYGEQPLYELSIELDGEQIRKRIAFRTLETVVKDDERGRAMFFRVNGRNVFAKGANWIPADALPARQTEESYRSLLESAKAANMNMIRVWGGGQYEADSFYDICDELGLLIWHDFMFSCATYPASREFLAGVAAEVSHQVKRLKDHPCIALWCGNNENLGALTWFPETRRSRDRYLVDYDRLYERTIGDLTEELDPDRTYWPSSPSGGRGDYSDNWHDDTKGDMHYWSVWHEGKPFDSYYEVTPRFCSEFGFQSFPSLSTVKGYAPEGERNLTSPTMEHHQRNNRGNTIIIESMSRYFRFPEGLENMLYLSQVQQAYAIRTAVEYWRSQRPVCMGALYWQLNDTWPVASWASLEHSGKWKLLQYAARRFFAPLSVVGFTKDGSVEVWVCNDTAETKRGSCTVSLLRYDGSVAQEERVELEVPADSSGRAQTFALSSLPDRPEELYLKLSFTSGSETVENDGFLAYPKLSQVRRATVESEISLEEGSIYVTLSSDLPAFFVTLDPGTIGGRFDDNCITLFPDSPRRLRFLPADARFSGRTLSESDLELFRAELTLSHLASSYR